ncbi:MAG: hypothetical protein GQ559_02395 [Desulfobulbaceae bacterium]|nr:hypothetical protein [Desulfobulbaceae bacterium]
MKRQISRYILFTIRGSGGSGNGIVTRLLIFITFLFISISSYDAFAQQPGPNEPVELPIRGGTWAFCNFYNNGLGLETFENAFNIRGHDWINPITWALFGFGQSFEGNCFGMSLLVDELGRSGSMDLHFSGRLEQPIWENYPYLNRNLRRDINTFNWRQMSVEFLRQWRDSSVRSPLQILRDIERDSDDGRFGMISITHGFSGHTMVPYGVIGNTIYMYDPNRPRMCAAGTCCGAYTQLQVCRNSWSFQMHNGETWTQEDGIFTYVSFHSTSDWHNLPNSIEDALVIILGNGAKAEQIVDGRGKKLFKHENPNSLSDVDRSSRGLGRDIVRLVSYVQKSDTSPQPPLRMSDSVQSKLTNTMLTRYQEKYGKDCEVYVVLNTSLKDLIIRATSKGGKAVDMMLGNREQIFEVTVSSDESTYGVQPEIRINAASNLKDGISIKERSTTPVNAKISHGFVLRNQEKLQLQTVENLSITREQTEVRLTPQNELVIRATHKASSVNVKKESIGVDGKTKYLGVKLIRIRQ